MKAHTYYIIFGGPPIGGKLPPFPPGGATAVHQRSGSSLSAVTNGTVSNQERPQDFGWGVNAPLPPGANFFENLTTKSVEMMVHSEAYPNKYVIISLTNQSSLVLLHPHPHSANWSFCMFSLFNFSSIFPEGGQLTHLPL